MIDQDLIDTVEDCITIDEPVDSVLVKEILDNYKKLIESNAELHKEIAKLRGEIRSALTNRGMGGSFYMQETNIGYKG